MRRTSASAQAPGNCSSGTSGTPRHGTERRTRRFMARPGTENDGTENLGTARHGKSWHGQLLARHGPEKYHKIVFWGNICLVKQSEIFLKCKSHHLAILINIWHIWDYRSRKVNMSKPDLRFFHETFDLLSARPFENLVRRGGYGFYLFPKKW